MIRASDVYGLKHFFFGQNPQPRHTDARPWFQCSGPGGAVVDLCNGRLEGGCVTKDGPNR